MKGLLGYAVRVYLSAVKNSADPAPDLARTPSISSRQLDAAKANTTSSIWTERRKTTKTLLKKLLKYPIQELAF